MFANRMGVGERKKTADRCRNIACGMVGDGDEVGNRPAAMGDAKTCADLNLTEQLRQAGLGVVSADFHRDGCCAIHQASLQTGLYGSTVQAKVSVRHH